VKRIILVIISFFSFFFFSSLIYPQGKKEGQIFFDTEISGQQVEEINKKLKSSNLQLPEIVQYVKKLDSIRDKARDCIGRSEEKIKALDELLKPLDLDQSLHGVDYKYLQDKRLSYAKKLSECRFYMYRIQEVLSEHNETIRKLSTHKILYRSTPIWKIKEKEVRLSFANIDISRMYAMSGLKSLTYGEFIALFFLLLAGLFVSIYLRLLCRQQLTKQDKKHQFFLSLTATFSIFTTPLVLLSFASVFFSLVFVDIFPNPTLELFCYSSLLFSFLLFLAKYIFIPPDSVPSVADIPLYLGKLIYKRFVMVSSWIFIGYVSVILFRGQDFPLLFLELFRAVFIVILSSLIFWFLSLFYKIPKLKKMAQGVLFLIKTITYSMLVVSVISECLGYHQLSVFIITGIVLSAIALAITIGLWHLTEALFHLIEDKKYSVAKKFRHAFGIRSHHRSHEISLIKFVFYLTLTCVFLLFLLRIWSLSSSFVDNSIDVFLYGFVVTGVKIVPLKIILAIVLFSLISLIGRLLATIVSRKGNSPEEKDTQVALSSIIIYISFAISLLFSLLIMGVSFTGIAIIGGALSVGIGFGLQSIANNFVSGIILLLEKPIKPGDRIVVGDTEGFVKRIRILSTRIKTLAKEDVIVPNADLVTNQVTNYMFRDYNWRVTCQVGVAYGSDVSLVKKLLLEAALRNQDVIHEEPNQPVVLFKNFGDSSLVFELWCIIHNVNKKFVVKSDLNYAIDELFRKHNVTIAFPQTDVHIKNPIITR